MRTMAGILQTSSELPMNKSVLCTTVTEITRITPAVYRIRFDHTVTFHPGQFVMVWVPGVDEVPMALAGGSEILVQEVGEATRALCHIGTGAVIGVRGPYGRGFPCEGRILAVGGGLGIAPLVPLAGTGHVTRFLAGARTKQDLDGFCSLIAGTDCVAATDDGTFGFHGTVADLLQKEDLSVYDSVAVCGPERMMEAVHTILADKGCLEKGWFSIHRYMKCGVGVCGSCCIDPHGDRVCRDGPVFPGTRLAGSEIGKYARDGSGRRKNFLC